MVEYIEEGRVMLISIDNGTDKLSLLNIHSYDLNHFHRSDICKITDSFRNSYTDGHSRHLSFTAGDFIC